MEAIYILFALAMLGAILLGPVFGFIGWLTSRENRRRLERLAVEPTRDLIRLHQRIDELERRLAAAMAAGEAAPVPPGETPVATERIVEARATVPAEDRPAEQSASLQVPREADSATAVPETAPQGEGGGVPAAATPEPAEGAEGPRVAFPEGRSPADSGRPEVVVDSPGEGAPATTAAPEGAEPRKEEGSPPPLRTPPGGGGGAGIDWERWIGLRGAAVLGGIVLALAALYFLKYSIEAGWISPVVRVALAVFVGLAALNRSQALRKRDYEVTANALAGAGVVILYAAVWAARVLYGLIGVGPAFLLMTLVTVVCGLLSARYRSLVVAVLGLAGGFATPALLSAGSHNPIGLFGYLLLLNAGLLVLAHRRRWPLLALLAVGVTGLYQAGWIFHQLRGDEGLLALVILGVFVVLFAAGTVRLPIRIPGMDPETPLPGWSVAGSSVFLAFVFALHLSAREQLEGRFLPLVGLLLLLSLAAQWMGKVHGLPWFPLAAAGASVAAAWGWLGKNQWGRGHEWPVAAGVLALALGFHLFLEWQERRSSEGEKDRLSPWAPGIAAGGLLLILTAAILGDPGGALLPRTLTGLALGAILVRQSWVPVLVATQTVAAAGLGIGAWSLLVRSGYPVSAGAFLGGTLAVGAAFQALGLQRRGDAGRWADRGAYVFPLLVLVGIVFTRNTALRMPLAFCGGTLLLGLLMVLAATRQRSGAGYAGVVAALALAHVGWADRLYALDLEHPQALLALTLQTLVVLLLTFWPLLSGPAFTSSRWAWYGAAAAGPLFFLPLRRVYEWTFGEGAIGLLPLALGGISLVAAFRSRHLWSAEEPLRKSSLVWFAAVALGFVSLAVPLQLEKEWITVAWALEGLATLALWKRLDHPGLKYLSLGLFAAVTVRLVANPAVLGYHQASGVPVVNWLSYTYLIPAACLLGGAYFLHQREVERRRPWETALYAKGWSVTAGACGLAAILVVFAWINLSIADYFSAGSRLTLTFERAAARDLTLSLAWGVFAILLLAIGIRRRWVALRWISLAFLVLTIGKVFLYDLGELEDLYRVASLVGLALSLILVSVVYQRFVFRKEGEEASSHEE